MIRQTEPLQVHGHCYDRQVLATPLEWILELRRDDVHAAVSTLGDQSVCSCGLVIPPGRDVVDTIGHLDQIEFHPVSTYVVSASTLGGEARYGAACSLCGWCTPAPDLRAAHVARRHHRCAHLRL